MQKTQKKLEQHNYHVERKKPRTINQLIDFEFYKDGRRQLYELELSEIEEHLKNFKKKRVLLYS
ncbi:Fur-regulated basic protein FbpA [Bacillus wiedmannii]|uniref:Fur-regulated basic protein FbpA n=1 Tax=Bacillus wiedmannii TaxID=1890302 RepID=A0A2B5KBT4_9BACI|nr:Fur-regulated basic protein FbpA [Bacillus wiedmannii]PEM34552.1 Fur-regulated basic protein FbpA [Bacillus wiedmannii]PEP31808.1 Fur-regulated basic protein FbpA [Bacillus wiedmannii]PFZ47042.1 Fur-regulated basic protein FbpA [Bacillus wiedmannii]PGA89497.1 Fur-regulated basic protein FbpA [Bacillus wiedmannii]